MVTVADVVILVDGAALVRPAYARAIFPDICPRPCLGKAGEPRANGCVGREVKCRKIQKNAL